MSDVTVSEPSVRYSGKHEVDYWCASFFKNPGCVVERGVVHETRMLWMCGGVEDLVAA